jgi:hypothetical protein
MMTTLGYRYCMSGSRVLWKTNVVIEEIETCSTGSLAPADKCYVYYTEARVMMNAFWTACIWEAFITQAL